MIDASFYTDWFIPILIIVIFLILLAHHKPEEDYFFEKISNYFKKRSTSIFNEKTRRKKVVFTLKPTYQLNKVVVEVFNRPSTMMIGTHFYPSSYSMARLTMYPRFSLDYYLFVKKRIPLDFSSTVPVKEIKLGIPDVDKNFIIATNDKELTEFIFRDSTFKKYLVKVFTLEFLLIEKEPFFAITIELKLKPYEAIYSFLAIERAIELMKMVRKPLG